jgi:nucleotide sugar dehydrogenase
MGFHAHGVDVTFVDTCSDRLDELRAAGHRAYHPNDMTMTDTDFVMISVSAPTTETGIDLSNLVDACKLVGAKITEASRPLTVVVRCTIPPGTMKSTLIPTLEHASGLRAGVGFGVVYNPEYLRAHLATEDFSSPRVITLGLLEDDADTEKRLRALFERFSAPIYTIGIEEAELQKYASNLYNAAKISFFNELRVLAEALGIDPETAFEITTLSAEGMWNPRYGTRDRGPYGGVCLPKDTNAWLKFVADVGHDSPLIAAVRQTNHSLGGN